MIIKYRIARGIQMLSDFLSAVGEVLEETAGIWAGVAIVDVAAIAVIGVYTGAFWASVGAVLWWNLIIIGGLIVLGLIIAVIVWVCTELKNWSDKYVREWKEDEWRGRSQ